MKRILVCLILILTFFLTSCNNISIDVRFNRFQIETQLVVSLSRARPNTNLRVKIWNVPRHPNRSGGEMIRNVTSNAEGRAEVTFTFPFHRDADWCDLTAVEKRQKGYIQVEDPDNPDREQRLSNVKQIGIDAFYSRPVGGRCP